jgi:Flp pilus assembly protein CpaB
MRIKGEKSSLTQIYAVTAGIVAGAIVFTGIQMNTGLTQVVVAKIQIRKGQTITKAMLETKSVPKALRPDTAYESTSTVIGLTTAEARVAGDLMLKGAIGSKAHAKATYPKSDQGRVAFLLPTADTLALKPFLRSGTRVNVISVNAGASGQSVASTVLMGAEVLSVAALDSTSISSKSPGIIVNITPIECERMSECLEAGPIRIAIVGFADE